MKTFNKIIWALSLVTLFTITSCNGQNRINRIRYKDAVDKSEIAKRIHKINQAQSPVGEQLLSNAGAVNFKYDLKTNGYFRYAGFSAEQINLALNGFVNISWNLEKNYLKMEGPKETAYVIKKDGVWYSASTYQNGNEVKKQKYIKDIGDFKAYVITECENDLALGVEIRIPIGEEIIIAFSEVIKFGIYGTADPILENALYPEYFFAAPNMRQVINGLSDLYKDQKNGFFAKEEYTSDGDANLACDVNSSINLEDMKKFDTGYDDVSGKVNLDFFSAWKDNLMYQDELIFNGNIIKNDSSTLNLNVDCYLSEQVESTCTIDNINLDEYETINS